MHIILYVFRPFNGFYGCISYVLPITYCLMQKHTPGMFLTDFHTRKYTGGIISRVGIFYCYTGSFVLTAAGSLGCILIFQQVQLGKIPDLKLL